MMLKPARFKFVATGAALMISFAPGCAKPPPVYWQKDGAKVGDFDRDNQQCRAQAFSSPAAGGLQAGVAYRSCMQELGWYQTTQR